ncbi:MAG: hypothetical protein H6586_03325 [Flavobacteriales bacterium]|nr:hypothetical protein [Flavobacteriales bacterium]
MNKLYSFTTDYISNTFVFQIEADNHIDAINTWYKKITTKNSFQNIDTLLFQNSLKNIQISELGQNLWFFKLSFNDNILLTHFIVSLKENEPFYNTEIAPIFIYEKLNDSEKSQISKDIINQILDLNFEFEKEMGYIKTITNDKGKSYIVPTEKIDHYDEIEQVKYIQMKLLEQGLNLSIDIIDLILDFEFVYMKSIGMFEEPDKIKLLDIEFNKLNDN